MQKENKTFILHIAILCLVTLPVLYFTKPTSLVGATVVHPRQGGTGVSTIPAEGEILIGSGTGVYTTIATSSLGITTTETDPVWSAVSTSLTTDNFTSDAISQWDNDIGYLTSYAAESDPIWTSEKANYLTTSTANSTYLKLSDSATSSWNTAYSWGDHSLAGYLTSFTETDPVWSAVSTSLTTANFATNTISQWINDVGYVTSTGGGGGTPAGASGQVQFNDIGSFGASANLFWNKTTNRLGVNTSTPKAPLTVQGRNSDDDIILAYTPTGIPAMSIKKGGAIGYGTEYPSGQVEYVGNSGQVDVYFSNLGGSPSTLRLVGAGGANYFQSATNPSQSGSSADIYFTSMFAAKTWMRIASNGSVLFPAVYGQTVGGTNRDLYIDSTGKIGYISSNRESKENFKIVEEEDVSFVKDLNVVRYDYKDKNLGTDQIGLIAEEVVEICPQCVSYKRVPIIEKRVSPTDAKVIIDTVVGYETTNEPETVNYSSPYMITAIIKTIQEQQEQIDDLQKKVDMLMGIKTEDEEDVKDDDNSKDKRNIGGQEVETKSISFIQKIINGIKKIIYGY